MSNKKQSKGNRLRKFLACGLTRCVRARSIASMVFSIMVAYAVADDNCVRNASFENYTGSFSGSYAGFSTSLTPEDWTYSPAGMVGLAKSKNGTWFASTCATPDGEFAVLFNRDGSITQNDIVIDDAGAYSVSFKYVSRGGSYVNGVFYIEIDGIQVGDPVEVGTVNTLFSYAERRAYLSTGTHKLTIRHSAERNPRINNNGGACSCIDAVSMRKVADADSFVQNGSFEGYNGVFSGKHQAFSSSLTPYKWEYSGSVGFAVSQDGTWFDSTCVTPDGGLAVYLQEVASISQTVTVDESGLYSVGFNYVSRGQVNANSNYQNGLFYLEIDDKAIGDPVDVGSVKTMFRAAAWQLPLSAGTHKLTIRHSNENNKRNETVLSNGKIGNGACSAIDAVFVRKTDNLILNGAFDMGTVAAVGASESTEDAYSNPGWSVTGAAGLAKPGCPSVKPWISSSIDSNVHSMYIFTANYTKGSTDRRLDPVSISQSFDVSKAGIYGLNFSYASRPYNEYKGGTIYVRVYKGDGLDGEKIYEQSVVATSLNEFQQFEGNVRLRSEGTYTLEFYAPQPEYVNGSENNRCSLIDNVSVVYQGSIPGLMIIFK